MEGRSKYMVIRRVYEFGLVGNGLYGSDLLPARHTLVCILKLEAVILGSGSHKETSTPNNCMFGPGWGGSLTIVPNRTGHPMLESAGGGESAKDVMRLYDHICLSGPEGDDLPKGRSLNSGHPGLVGGGESEMDVMCLSGLVICMYGSAGGRLPYGRKNPVGPVSDSVATGVGSPSSEIDPVAESGAGGHIHDSLHQLENCHFPCRYVNLRAHEVGNGSSVSLVERPMRLAMKPKRPSDHFTPPNSVCGYFM